MLKKSRTIVVVHLSHMLCILSHLYDSGDKFSSMWRHAIGRGTLEKRSMMQMR